MTATSAFAKATADKSAEAHASATENVKGKRAVNRIVPFACNWNQICTLDKLNRAHSLLSSPFHPTSTASSSTGAGAIPCLSMTTISPKRKIAMKTTALEKAQMKPNLLAMTVTRIEL